MATLLYLAGWLVLAATAIPGRALAVDIEHCSDAARSQWSSPQARGADSDITRLHGLGRELRRAFLNSNFPAARTLAAEYLTLAAKYPCSEGYGDAIYGANSYLGRISIKDGDVAAAGQYLLAAGKTPGSGVLDSIGPDLTLANQLLRAGQVDTVVKFLQEIRAFWKPGQRQLDSWTADIEAGQRPFLNPLEGAPTGTVVTALSVFGFLFLVPAILVLFVFLAVGRGLRHKWSFLMVSCVVAYAAVIAVPLTHLADKFPVLTLIVQLLCVYGIYRIWKVREAGA